MARRKTILQSQYPYHVTARSNNRDWFKLKNFDVWSIFADYLFFLHHTYHFKIHSFVLMNNHFHLIVSTPDSNLSDGMNYFMREVSRQISFEARRINHNFGGPYHWCILDSYEYYLNAYKYVYRNPVEAGLCKHCEDYPWSTLHGLLGSAQLSVPVTEDTLLFDSSSLEKELLWLNQGNKKDFQEVARALKKQRFHFERLANTGKPKREKDYVF